jgi:hypothetical protein
MHMELHPFIIRKASWIVTELATFTTKWCFPLLLLENWLPERLARLTGFSSRLALAPTDSSFVFGVEKQRSSPFQKLPQFPFILGITTTMTTNV